MLKVPLSLGLEDKVVNIPDALQVTVSFGFSIGSWVRGLWFHGC